VVHLVLAADSYADSSRLAGDIHISTAPSMEVLLHSCFICFACLHVPYSTVTLIT
jgi:hypothetical protein